MSRFFQRIFFSVWVILILTFILTLFAASLLPASNDDEGNGYDTQMVNVIARDFRELLGADPDTAVDAVVNRHVLDFDRLLQIYVIDPNGDDVLGRYLPLPVSRLLRRNDLVSDAPVAIRDPRLDVHNEGLGGYLVVGYQSDYPLARVLVRPGGRLLLLTIALLASAAISFVLARFIVLPVRRLREAGQQVADGDLSVRVAHTVGKRTDDIAKLAHDFDVMTERVEQLIHSQQRLMRDVSHELRSPLARLQAMLSIARQKADSDDAEIDRMEQELERLDELIGEILSFARLETLESIDRRPTDIVDLVRTIADDAAIEGQHAGKDVRVSGPEQCVMALDSGLMQRALENVIRNALKYTRDRTSVEATIDDRGSSVLITVEDHGPGVPEDALPKLFEPFYRVSGARRPKSGGGGIGLAIAERSVHLHDGSIRAVNRAGDGLRVEIALPKGQAENL